jgi:hypothetical protein
VPRISRTRVPTRGPPGAHGIPPHPAAAIAAARAWAVPRPPGPPSSCVPSSCALLPWSGPPQTPLLACCCCRIPRPEGTDPRPTDRRVLQVRVGPGGRRTEGHAARGCSPRRAGYHTCARGKKSVLPESLGPSDLVPLREERTSSFRNRNGPARPSAAGRTRPPGRSREEGSGPAGAHADRRNRRGQNALFRRIGQPTRCQQKEPLRPPLPSAVGRNRAAPCAAHVRARERGHRARAGTAPLGV